VGDLTQNWCLAVNPNSYSFSRTHPLASDAPLALRRVVGLQRAYHVLCSPLGHPERFPGNILPLERTGYPSIWISDRCLKWESLCHITINTSTSYMSRSRARGSEMTTAAVAACTPSNKPSHSNHRPAEAVRPPPPSLLGGCHLQATGEATTS